MTLWLRLEEILCGTLSIYTGPRNLFVKYIFNKRFSQLTQHIFTSIKTETCTVSDKATGRCYLKIKNKYNFCFNLGLK